MSNAKLTEAGQVTIPKAILDALGVRPGDRVVFRLREDGTVVLEADKIDVRSLRGIVKSKVKGVTVEEMNEAIRKAGSGQ